MNYKTNDQYPKLLGLIGKPLRHSFSKKYFTEKFESEGLEDYVYDTFPLACIHYINILRRDNENLIGLNVTIPYKESVIDFLDDLDETAREIGAVNTIKCEGKKYVGYNTDAMGFEKALQEFIKAHELEFSGALVLGSGGASKAVRYVLNKLNIKAKTISREEGKGDLTYDQIDREILEQFNLIVNTTPLGTFPKVKTAPEIPYELLSKKNALFDLVYNPGKTLFLERGLAKGCPGINGLNMLHAQAEMAWKIWTKN